MFGFYALKMFSVKLEIIYTRHINILIYYYNRRVSEHNNSHFAPMTSEMQEIFRNRNGH